jgi:dihydrofolate reductase
MTTQRKIIAALFVSLDGVAEAPETWHMSYVDEEMMGAIMGTSDRIDTFLLGRNTFESHRDAFANADVSDPVVAMMHRPARVVVSTTLGEDTGWPGTTVIADDVEARLRALKEQPGKDLLTTGSIQLVRAMLGYGVLDELHLFIHPLVVGAGERLFEADGPRVPLTVLKSHTLGNGVIHVEYQVGA